MKTPILKTKFKSKEEVCLDLNAQREQNFISEDFVASSGKILI